MTIKDIAALAGVSKSTVSRVINNAENVDEKTRAAVLKIIEEHDFLPSAVARGLSSRGNNAIGLVLPDVDNSFFAPITQGVNEVLADSRYTMILCCTVNDPKLERKALKTLRQQQVSGVLLTTSADFCNKQDAEELRQTINSLNVPVVLIDRALKNTLWNGIYSDNVNGAYTATNALIQAGFTRIGAFISDMLLSLGQERLLGFRQALTENKIEINPQFLHLYDTPASLREIYQYTCRLIDENCLPDAVFLSNCIIAHGFYKAILEKGIMPGRDIHCIGFDYSETLDILHTPYSYLERNCKLIGQTAANLLLRLFHETSLVREEHIVPAVLHIDDTLNKLSKSEMIT